MGFKKEFKSIPIKPGKKYQRIIEAKLAGEKRARRFRTGFVLIALILLGLFLIAR